MATSSLQTLARQCDIKDVLQTRVMPNADCYTDHRLVRCKVAFSFKPDPKKKGAQTKKLHVQWLRNREVVQKRQTKIKEKLDSPAALIEDPLQQWEQLKLALQEASVEAIGFVTRKNRDWFDESDNEIQKLLEKERSCHKFVLARPNDRSAKAAYREACSSLHRLRTLKNNWWTEIAEHTQRLADAGDTGPFYEALKAVFGPHHQTQAPLRSLDG